jgi:hypothetical protein
LAHALFQNSLPLPLLLAAAAAVAVAATIINELN